MDTAVRKRPSIWAARDGDMLVPHPVAYSGMTREAREARITWRLEHLDGWQRELEDLSHFEPSYPYDVVHEYEAGWTTDPTYSSRSIPFVEFDEDGVQQFDDAPPQVIELYMRDTMRDRVGYRVAFQTLYTFMPEVAERLGLRTRQGGPANSVKPDLLVMPSEEDLDPARVPEDRLPRPDDSVPELVLEILSNSTAARDLNDKRRLYEALGILEYLLYDLGGKRWDGSPRELLMYRLEDGVYRQAVPEPKLSASDPDVHWSDVFDAHIRMLPASSREGSNGFSRPLKGYRPPPVFQWYDLDEGRWRDRESDREFRYARGLQDSRTEGRTEGRAEGLVEGRAEGREEGLVEGRVEGQVEGETRVAVAMMRRLLSGKLADEYLDRVEAAWHRDRPPPNVVDRILTVQETPNVWRSLLLPDDDPDPDRPA